MPSSERRTLLRRQSHSSQSMQEQVRVAIISRLMRLSSIALLNQRWNQWIFMAVSLSVSDSLLEFDSLFLFEAIAHQGSWTEHQGHGVAKTNRALRLKAKNHKDRKVTVITLDSSTLV